MRITGHRGASGHQPENTFAAFRAALAMGANSIELDVHRCKSGEMVVIHDDRVDRTSNGTGRVKDLTLDQLRQLDFGQGQRISTLDEVLSDVSGRCLGGKNPHVFVELKGPGAKQVAQTLHENVRNGRFSYDDYTVIGFNHAQVFQFARKNPEIATGLSFDEKHPQLQRAMVPLAKRLGASAINPHHSLVTPGVVEKAHAAGLKVNTWTVNEPADMRRVKEAGVDTIMSDYPDRAKRIVNALSAPATALGR